MSAPNPSVRVVTGPIVAPDGTVVVPAGAWAVMTVPEPRPDADGDAGPGGGAAAWVAASAPRVGSLIALCRSEQEADRTAREVVFAGRDPAADAAGPGDWFGDQAADPAAEPAADGSTADGSLDDGLAAGPADSPPD